MILFFGTWNSQAVSDDSECGGSDSTSLHCMKKLSSDLKRAFRDENGGLQSLYLKKFVMGKEITYAGSVTNIQDDCVEELIMDYDSERFPQYIINSVCRDSCSAKEMPFGALKLDRSECDDRGLEKYDSQKPPFFLTVCVKKSTNSS